MIINQINLSLINLGFHKMGLNKDNIHLFQHIAGQKAYIITIFDCPLGTEYSTEQLNNIEKQIHNHYLSKEYSNIHSLGIICTRNPEKVGSIAKNNSSMWIVDTLENRLIIYENQKEDFLNLKKVIEDVLIDSHTFKTIENHKNIQYTYPDYVSKKTTKSVLSQYISKWNTIIIVTNVLVYLIINFISGLRGKEDLLWSGAVYWPAIMYLKEYYRLFTYMFLHSGSNHLANNMIVLFFIGDNLERAAGKWRFLIIYFGSGFIAGIVSMSYNMLKGFNVISVGASGAIFGVVGAMVYIVILNKGRLENISTRQMVLFVMFSLYGGLTSQGVDNAAHIGGLLSGFILAAIFYRRPKKNIRRRTY